MEECEQTIYAKRAPDRDSTSPYGPAAIDLGLRAIFMFECIDTKPIWRGGTNQRWLLNDREAFMDTMEYLFSVREAQTKPLIDVGPPARDHSGVALERHLESVHEALPFTEGERHWLIQTFYYPGGRGDLGRPESSIRDATRTEPYVLSAGRQQSLDGQSLLDRWYAWRRDIFEFKGEGSRETACKALLGIGEILVPAAVEMRDTSPRPSTPEV